MKIRVSQYVKNFEFTPGEIGFDCGRVGVAYECETPIGIYGYYREPQYDETCDGPLQPGEQDHSGEMLVYGPFGADDDAPTIAWCGNGLTAKRIIRGDIAARIEACLKDDEGSDYGLATD